MRSESVFLRISDLAMGPVAKVRSPPLGLSFFRAKRVEMLEIANVFDSMI